HGKAWTTLAAGVTSLERGWCWCWMAALTDDSTTLALQVALESTEGKVGYLGDGTSGACFGNLRLERGQVPTLVLPLTSSSSSFAGRATPRGTEDGQKAAIEMGEYYDRFFSK